MKTRIMALFASLILINSAYASSDEDQIKTLVSKYEVALNTSDTESVLKLYGKNSIFMPQNSVAQIGKVSIKNAYDNVFKNIKLNIAFTIHKIEVLGDTAWLRTTSKGKTKILANKMMIDEGNNELFILKNTNKQWKIHQYIFATSNPRH